jgi:arginyl-tRNA synthetase
MAVKKNKKAATVKKAPKKKPAGKKTAVQKDARKLAKAPAKKKPGRPAGSKKTAAAKTGPAPRRGRPPGPARPKTQASLTRKPRNRKEFLGRTLKSAVAQAILETLPEGPLREARIPLEYAREEKFGDYAATAAMDREFREILSRRNPKFKNPREAGQYLVDHIRKSEGSAAMFSNLELAGPGFLNLTVSTDILLGFLQQASSNPSEYGRTRPQEKRSILFEFVSANPTGPLNVVSARAAALGDSCCNLLDWAGENVFREYYVNDYGNQIKLLGESCFLRALEAQGVPVKFSEKSGDTVTYPDGPGLPFPSEGYHGEIIKDCVQEIQRRKTVLIGPKLVEHAMSVARATDVPLDFLSQHPAWKELAERMSVAAVNVFLDTQRRDLERFRVRYDNFYRESDLHKQNKVAAARNFLEGYVRKENGKEIFESTKFGDDQDRVIVREDGRPTYLLADIAYHKAKMDRGYTELLNIWGPDHHGYIKRLAGALVAMGYPEKAFRVLIAQQVNLLENGKPFVMSKRAGRFITMETLMNEIPVDVLRYFFVMRSFEAHLDFDFAEAMDTSEKNPYYYVAYAHARICSIAKKAAEKGFLPLGDSPDFDRTFEGLEWTADRRRLLFMVARFPEEVQDAARSLEPHRLVNYLYQLASGLSRFYAPRENRIIEQEERTARALLTLLDGVRICLANGLSILGMKAPDHMTREEADQPG